eukprot:TRINITY_DN18019_c0_g4_i1.p2 TRINITY_DN18019_c0_g4~~TRINITY_DN18019_c0_g4_i1.p2  ORF type:complete len:104 (-),score=24.91 TRINITY_DN18019_c0_g4_i1:174-440(-)
MGRTKQTARKKKNKKNSPNQQQDNQQQQGTGRGKGGKGLGKLAARKSIYKEQKKVDGLNLEEQLATVDVDDVKLEDQENTKCENQDKQ